MDGQGKFMEGLLKYLRNKIYCLRHGHSLKFITNFWGPNIELVGARSIWECEICKKIIYSDEHYYGKEFHEQKR